MNKIALEISARHVHLSRGDADILFGEGYEFKHKRELSQPGQYIEEERVRLEGPKGAFASVGILGPVRPATQVEITLTDARALGITAPVRESGDVKGSAGIRIIGPKGQLDIPEGVIVAKRHIHIDPETAAAWDVKDKDNVKIKVENTGRSLIFDEVVVRVSPSFVNSMHLDVDEANAAGLTGQEQGVVVK